ncbi:ribosome biogenesis GTPase [Spiroplasma syrphidicola EA-1]|uniref:Small ribosomal subunit biogenesis GTPase RsgA n=1 Tax=Spiroplasma syrphidicola EA-1 TaxID=1276229 RepID=R4UEP6_9MOLU|nr:ribosome small subunit-dependent GTPase A [Spiroplasma syrphidicola]AGM26399.1 ribosome biogenesis GTPase [Spiroplasma syrphidicola EA-1]
MEKTGLIVSVISEFCYVKEANNDLIYECKSKGLFRHHNQRPLVGDHVDFIVQNNDQGTITKIHPRKNELYRPKIANIDQTVIITSLQSPNFSSYLLNKFLAIVEYKGITPVIVFTKKDLLGQDDDLYDKYLQWYPQMGYQTFILSNKTPDSSEWDAFKATLINKISVFTGQTGSGKSTTINTLLEQNLIKTQEISKALGRGKHTTTNSKMYEISNGIVIDTPGFSSFDLREFNPEKLAISYHLFTENSRFCKFRHCLHLNEPHCKIKELVTAKIIPTFFYNDYCKIISEITERK